MIDMNDVALSQDLFDYLKLFKNKNSEYGDGEGNSGKIKHNTFRVGSGVCKIDKKIVLPEEREDFLDSSLWCQLYATTYFPVSIGDHENKEKVQRYFQACSEGFTHIGWVISSQDIHNYHGNSVVKGLQGIVDKEVDAQEFRKYFNTFVEGGGATETEVKGKRACYYKLNKKHVSSFVNFSRAYKKDNSLAVDGIFCFISEIVEREKQELIYDRKTSEVDITYNKFTAILAPGRYLPYRDNVIKGIGGSAIEYINAIDLD